MSNRLIRQYNFHYKLAVLPLKNCERDIYIDEIKPEIEKGKNNNEKIKKEFEEKRKKNDRAVYESEKRIGQTESRSSIYFSEKNSL